MHVSLGCECINFIKILKGNAVFLKFILIGDEPPYQCVGRDRQGLLKVDYSVGHDDAASSYFQAVVWFAIEEAVEADKDISFQIGFDDFSAMGGYVASLQAGVDDKAVLLGVGAFAEPGIFQIGTLGNQHIVFKVALAFDNRISADGCS